jgi:hypothetical protein
MMYHLLFFCAFWCLTIMSAQGQTELAPPTFGAIDTLFIENFDSDTFNIPLGFPSGQDQTWINYDVDNVPQICFLQEDTYGWFPYVDETDTSNYAMTSCSYIALGTGAGLMSCPTIPDSNQNWLIMPPIYVSDANMFLRWKSLPLVGPFFMDGYKVLIAEGSNMPEDFQNTAFVAAECIELSPSPSLNPANHFYSPGYIHAKTYTLTQYYQLAFDQGGAAYLQGLFEPHSVSLADYVGKTIYCAFLHDSYCDFGLQLDDVLVTRETMMATEQPFLSEALQVAPNPTKDYTFLIANALHPTTGLLQCYDMAGKLLQSTDVRLYGGRNEIPVNVEQLAAGYYQLRLLTAEGQAQVGVVVRP